jgi:lipoprotein NlpI
MWRWILLGLSIVFATSNRGASQENPAANEPPVTDAATQDKEIETISAELNTALKEKLNKLPAIDPAQPGAVDLYSQRGDLQMFLGDFAQAEADYRAMVRLKPDLDASHWRLGIAMYFAGHPKDAAAQFDKYHSFDNVDRENGIWRYLSHRAAFSREMARKELLRYETDDRPPFREVYQLFQGSMTPEEVLSAVTGDLSREARESRLFFAAESDPDEALKSLRLAVLNPWPRKAGFGPEYMWHVGRLRYVQLKAQQDAGKPKCEEI